ncbi:cytochrome P450 [Nocardia sp. NPDC020380]|uniref:cytochrome P450 n=1 Tax=Nocardia sp. NPDC020380 TaxID=3364309 RepID=UPI0037BAD569
MLSIFDEGFAREPWGVLRSLREDGGVHRVATPDGPPAWLVTRYAEVRGGLLEDRLSVNLRYAQGDDYRGFSVPAPLDVFQTSGPQELARLRGTVVGELRKAGEWSDRAADATRACLAELDGTGEFDFMERVALPLPALVLGQLLGLADDERDELTGWAESTLRPGATPRARDTLATMQHIIAAIVAREGENPHDNMVGRLVRAGIGGGPTGSAELGGLLFYLLFVWYEVLMDVLGGAVLTLSGDSDARETLLSVSDRTVAVDELLRFLSPQVLSAPRFATTGLEIGGQRIAAGETVLLCLAAANRDPERFSTPDELDLRRGVNPHLALGHGAHACVGTGFVKPVVGAILAEIYTRLPGLRVEAGESAIGWRSGFRHRGPIALPVTAAGADRVGRAASIAPL